MFRKDFELIASIVRSLPVSIRGVVALVFADKLAGTNKSFDRQRFLDACQ